MITIWYLLYKYMAMHVHVHVCVVQCVYMYMLTSTYYVVSFCCRHSVNFCYTSARRSLSEDDKQLQVCSYIVYILCYT